MIPSIICAAYPNAVNGKDFEVKDDGQGAFISKWNEESIGAPKPAQEQLDKWKSDQEELPTGQTFSDWKNENGDDVTMTRRKQAKDLLFQGEMETLIMAIYLVIVDEIKRSNPLAVLLARTPSQLYEATIEKITSGQADN